MSALSVQGLHKSFGRTKCRGIDLDVGEHQVVCLIGASGSGKSTLLRCINLLEPIDAGRVVIDDVQVTGPRGSTSTQSAAAWASCFKASTCSRK